jgi:hypothetical protein
MKRLALVLALLAAPVSAQSYDPTLLPAQIIGAPTTMTPLNLGDDNTRLVEFGFPFEYFGQTFTSAWVSSNGFVSFQSGDSLCCNGMPMEQAQRNTIYAYWSDLISGGNPYYRLTSTDALFGWYGTKEYGTNNSETFEINLSPSGAIQINYGAVANRYHIVAAGITGPGVDDNIQLFLGTNVANLSFQSGLLTPTAPVVTPTVDCAATPNAPECVQSYTPVATPVAETVSQSDIVAEAIADTPVVAEATAEVQEITAETATEAANQVDEAARTEEPKAETEKVAERLSPDQVLALAAGGMEQQDSAAQSSEQIAATEAVAAAASVTESQSSAPVATEQAATQSEAATTNVVTERVQMAQEAQDVPQQTVTTVTVADAEQAVTDDLHSGFKAASVEPDVLAVEVAQPPAQDDMGSPASQVTTMELLSNSMPEMGPQPEMTGNTNDAMAEMAVVPAGYGSYVQARIPDAPFYAPKDIYKKRKIPDAYWELYRMMRSQDAAWNAMVEDQYE